MNVAIGTTVKKTWHFAGKHYLPIGGAVLAGTVIGLAIPLGGSPTPAVRPSTAVDVPSIHAASRLPLTIYYLISNDEQRDLIIVRELQAAKERVVAGMADPPTSVEAQLARTPEEEVSVRQRIAQDIDQLPADEVNYRLVDLRGGH